MTGAWLVAAGIAALAVALAAALRRSRSLGARLRARLGYDDGRARAALARRPAPPPSSRFAGWLPYARRKTGRRSYRRRPDIDRYDFCRACLGTRYIVG